MSKRGKGLLRYWHIFTMWALRKPLPIWGKADGKNEIDLRECVTSRYPRDAYILTNKLSTHHFTKNEEIRPLFESQLSICGVEYFDFYLMHALDKNIFAKYKECRAYETALEFLAEGKIKHLGISFHDQADVLEQILTEYPQIEVVQIQLNYVDFDDPSVQSRKCLEVCRKYGKPAIIMEPVEGGNLVNLPEEAQKVFVESAAIEKVCDIFKNLGAVPCTACRYCTEVCPQKISIPDLFACLNAKKIFNDWNTDYYYNQIHTQNGGKAGDCVKCDQCENICPQHLSIRALLEDVAKEFEKE